MQHFNTPQHIAIIMDGNGRWARKRHLPRLAGHARGVKRVREIVEACVARKIPYLTLFAFSTENWKRPPDEVKGLLRLFAEALEREVEMLHRNGVRLRIVGDISAFDAALQKLIHTSEAKTAANTALTMTIAVNYGGRWDITQAMLRWFVNQFAPTAPRSRQDWLDMLAHIEQQQRDMPALEEALKGYISTAYAPDPDLLIRTGGECRISNFMLWQLAYAEIYFTDAFWPEFSEQRLDEAIEWFAQRERRFGKTSEQLQKR